jgi:hypothetical protein
MLPPSGILVRQPVSKGQIPQSVEEIARRQG